MVWNRKGIRAAFVCGALAMPAVAGGAEISAEDALLARISSEVIPRMQREYLRTNLERLGKGETIDIAVYILSESVDRWYVEGIFDGVNALPHPPIPGEEVVVTGELIQQWQLSPFLPYYLEVNDIPDCTAMLSNSCRWQPLTLTLSP
ncbi:hypothetical protein N2600_01275 [Rhizobium sp. WSM1274]|uniref:hypothetical protein n=2 Tax=Rhizobium sp. WSM1274 TaxID=3138254 RepID=UPI0021A644FD|nr:hypothetical protein [Rhizobium leguminosarum]UWU28641.1 hypothetical protein N2600_01275 [Rhizobium leguminosarum bv. viciae]